MNGPNEFCTATVWTGWTEQKCRHRAKTGSEYCGVHDPENVKKRAEKVNKKRNLKWDIEEARRRVRRAEGEVVAYVLEKVNAWGADRLEILAHDVVRARVHLQELYDDRDGVVPATPRGCEPRSAEEEEFARVQYENAHDL
jgi:hypothetical protein